MTHARGSAVRASLSCRLLAAGAVCLALAACSGPGQENCWSTSSDPEHLPTRPSPLDSALVTLGDAEAKVCGSKVLKSF